MATAFELFLKPHLDAMSREEAAKVVLLLSDPPAGLSPAHEQAVHLRRCRVVF